MNDLCAKLPSGEGVFWSVGNPLVGHAPWLAGNMSEKAPTETGGVAAKDGVRKWPEVWVYRSVMAMPRGEGRPEERGQCRDGLPWIACCCMRKKAPQRPAPWSRLTWAEEAPVW